MDQRGKNSDMDLQRNGPIDSLPEDIRVLFDPTRRGVPSGVWFLPYDTANFVFDVVIFGLIAGGSFGFSGIFGVVVMTVSILNGTYRAGDFSDVLVYVAVYLILAGLIMIGAFSFWKPLWYEALAWREKRAGQLRRGLFLTPKVMIVRMKTNYCDVLPRGQIVAAELRGFRRPTLFVFYSVPGGKPQSYDLAGAVSFGAIHHRLALAHIQEWAGVKAKKGKN
jgi:hypothetical protein